MAIIEQELVFSRKDEWPTGYDYKVTVTPVVEGNTDFRGPPVYWFLKDRSDANDWFDEMKYRTIQYSKYPCMILLEQQGYYDNPIFEELVG